MSTSKWHPDATKCKLELRMLYREIRDEPWTDENGKAGVLTGIALAAARLDRMLGVRNSKDAIHVWLNSDHVESIQK